MKKKVLMVLLAATLSVSMIAGCGSKGDNNTDTTKTESKQDSDQEAADKVAKLIDDIYVQERTDKTDEQCTAAKEAWDALTDAQKELVEGENADPDYFGRDTGDASKDDPLNADEIVKMKSCSSFEHPLMTAVRQISVVLRRQFRQLIRTGL